MTRLYRSLQPRVVAVAGVGAVQDKLVRVVERLQAYARAWRVRARFLKAQRIMTHMRHVGRPEDRVRAVGLALMRIPQPRFDFAQQKRYDKLAIFRPSSNGLKSLKSRPFGSERGVVCTTR